MLAHLKQPILREYNDLTTSKNLLPPTMILQPVPSNGNAPIAVMSGWNLSLCGTQPFEDQTVWKTTHGQYLLRTVVQLWLLITGEETFATLQPSLSIFSNFYMYL